ncbi:MAG: outer-membrane lipoprotein carrier protein LolA [Flavobacteriaceae bacterium]|nr:outer-membrane lipoprotein carrier protein LolA [Flavobacteriaceae bacterium]
MKKAYTLLILILNTLVIFSQNDPKAEELLNKVSENIKGYESMYININHNLSNLEEDIDQTNKVSFVKKGTKYNVKWNNITFIYDGEKLFTINPDDEEVTVSTEDLDEESTITPNKILTFFEDGYEFKMDITQDVTVLDYYEQRTRKLLQYIKLIPIDSESEIDYILLAVEKKNNRIYKSIEKGKNGTTTTYTITSFEVDLPLDDDLFLFNKKEYKDYYINNID